MTLRKSVPIDYDEKEFVAAFKRSASVSSKDQPAVVTLEPTSEQTAAPSSEPSGSTTSKVVKPRRGKKEEYLSTFFEVKDDISPRFGKSVTIRPKYHKTIQQIVTVIADDRITIFNYLDNVLANHLKIYEDAISEVHTDRSIIKIKH